MSWNDAWYRPDVLDGRLLRTLRIVEQKSEERMSFPQTIDVVFSEKSPGKAGNTLRELASRSAWCNALTGEHIPDEDIAHIALFSQGSAAPYLLLPVLPHQAAKLKARVEAALSPAVSLNGTAVKNAKAYIDTLLQKGGIYV